MNTQDTSHGLSLRRAGYETAVFLASGAEGSVYALDGGTVAKVWTARSRAQLQRIKTFYDSLAHLKLPFATPQVFDIVELDDAFATIEKRLEGRPLREDWPGISPILDKAYAETVVFVLRALAAARPSEDVNTLPPLDEEESPWAGGVRFTARLSTLIGKRTDRFAPLLRHAVSDFDAVRDQTIAALQSLAPVAPGVVHGDLIPANILVNDDGVVTAVLDFGFFSAAGDPAFDAAVTPVIADMYGPSAADTQAQFDAAIGSALPINSRTLNIYRAAYALATSNAFSADGADGHFRWCTQLLGRPEVKEAIA